MHDEDNKFYEARDRCSSQLYCCAWCLRTSAQADEGMWTFDNFPSKTVSAKYGFMPSQEWLDHVRLASLRIAGGCSASFISPQGLVMTNHHCVVDCVEQLSTPKQNFVDDGFVAKTMPKNGRVRPLNWTNWSRSAM